MLKQTTGLSYKIFFIGLHLLIGTRSFAQDQAPFVVVELFTSEGCSSCPPADNLLSQILMDARQNKERVFPLSFHVDYWDQLGWADPFSQRSFSQRQRQYNHILGTATYTPQMIVNGKEAFNGARQDMAEKLTAHYLSIRPNHPLRVSLVKETADHFFMAYATDAAPSKNILQIAVVERGLASQVTRGENAGRLLEHNNVVRSFVSIPLERSAGEVRLAKPPLKDPSQVSIIAYLQDTTSLEILNAQEVEAAR